MQLNQNLKTNIANSLARFNAVIEPYCLWGDIAGGARLAPDLQRLEKIFRQEQESIGSARPVYALRVIAQAVQGTMQALRKEHVPYDRGDNHMAVLIYETGLLVKYTNSALGSNSKKLPPALFHSGEEFFKPTKVFDVLSPIVRKIAKGKKIYSQDSLTAEQKQIWNEEFPMRVRAQYIADPEIEKQQRDRKPEFSELETSYSRAWLNGGVPNFPRGKELLQGQ